MFQFQLVESNCCHWYRRFRSSFISVRFYGKKSVVEKFDARWLNVQPFLHSDKKIHAQTLDIRSSRPKNFVRFYAMCDRARETCKKVEEEIKDKKKEK